ncbi:hypothetical protein JJB09_22695 [Rhizobium sp. KVB221]|uniref:Uncharacterized protein n=1 Tax=Rhizobium setariae TaxID=2801340 RepID=A0A937CPE7_9HYPH|nr:hypothetical protein [Rhizobium setariae]MBL0374826.1 hypothetical protein [Rhizobium setariae]
MRTGYLATAALAVAFAFIAKDLVVPLVVVASFGLVDRVIGRGSLKAPRFDM